MIEAEHHQRVRIVENARVDRKFLARLVDALVHGDVMPVCSPTSCWKRSSDRWKSSSVPAMPCRNIRAEHSGVS